MKPPRWSSRAATRTWRGSPPCDAHVKAISELDKRKARQLADEAGSIRSGGELLDLDAELTAIAEVARWCAHASGRSWLRIEGP